MNLSGQAKMGIGALKCLMGSRIPLNVMVSVTDHCPSRCSYCQIPARARKDISTADWKKIFVQMAEVGTKRIGVWGGEPLIRNDINELCGFAQELGMYVSLDSNGYLLPDNLEILNNIDHLVLSYDGPKEAHDKNREKGSWEKVTTAIKIASGKVRLWTITVLTKNNIHLIDEIMSTADEFGFMTTFQTLHHNDTLGGNTASMMPTTEEYSKAFKKLIKLKSEGAPILLSKKYLTVASKWKDYSKTRILEKFYNTTCKAGQVYCNIDVDGKVYPCSLLIGEYPEAKNALDIGFKKAFLDLKNRPLPCNACTASCYPEYNYLYSLDLAVALDWASGVRRTDKLLKKMKQKGE